MRRRSGDAMKELERVAQVFRAGLTDAGIEIVDVIMGPTACVWARAFDIGDDAVADGMLDDMVLEAALRMAEHASRTIRGIKPCPAIVAVDVLGRRLAYGRQYTFHVKSPVML